MQLSLKNVQPSPRSDKQTTFLEGNRQRISGLSMFSYFICLGSDTYGLLISSMAYGRETNAGRPIDTWEKWVDNFFLPVLELFSIYFTLGSQLYTAGLHPKRTSLKFLKLFAKFNVIPLTVTSCWAMFIKFHTFLVINFNNNNIQQQQQHFTYRTKLTITSCWCKLWRNLDSQFEAANWPL